MKTPQTVYHLILQDEGRELLPIADIVSATPFPRIEQGDTLTVEGTQPSVWDVTAAMTKIAYSPDGTELHVPICLVVDSPCDRLN